MRSLLTQIECQKFDRDLQEHLNLSSELLMEAAVTECATVISKVIKLSQRSEVLIVCGPGNNGADGLALARHLHARSLRVQVFGPQGSMAPLFKVQKERLTRLGIQLETLEVFSKQNERSKSAIIVDALFGVGLNKSLERPYDEVVDKINRSAAYKVSLDVPSGLNINSGSVFGKLAVRADLTLAIGALKPGFFTADGPLCCGRIHLINAGFAKKFCPPSSHFLITPHDLQKWIPQRSRRSHKGSVGKCHLIAGSQEYLGAGKLVAMGALASGSAFVQVYGDLALQKILNDLPEIIFKPSFHSESLKPKDVVIIGSGVTDGNSVQETMTELIEMGHQKVVVDAGALKGIKGGLPKTWVLTPHPGELAEMLKCTVAEIEGDRFKAARETEEKFGAQVLLKGFRPVFQTSRQTWCLPYGDDRLGKAGTGDVLAGLIGGLMAQMEDTARATALAVFLQAKSAEALTKDRGRHSLLTSELPPAIGRLLKKLQESATISRSL